MATTSAGKLLAIAVVGSLVMMIALSLLSQRIIETRPTPQQPLSPELREARTVEDEQSYMQLLNNITSATTTTTTPSSGVPTNQTIQIIQNVRNECESGGFLGMDCVSLVYESSRTIVVGGALLTVGSTSQFAGDWNNPFIWKVVDSFKELGYSLTSVELGGQGIENNPHTWYVVMSK